MLALGRGQVGPAQPGQVLHTRGHVQRAAAGRAVDRHGGTHLRAGAHGRARPRGSTPPARPTPRSRPAPGGPCRSACGRLRAQAPPDRVPPVDEPSDATCRRWTSCAATASHTAPRRQPEPRWSGRLATAWTGSDNLLEERGRPRSGGQPGPSTRQAPGGRSRCADPLYPQGGADDFMVDHLPFNRNSFATRFAAEIWVVPRTPQPIADKPSSQVRPPSTPQGDGTPQSRGAIDRDPPRVTRRAFCSCRTGTSPSRSVHQWTARAWVPDGVTVAVGLTYVDLPPCVPPPRPQSETLDFRASGRRACPRRQASEARAR